LLALGFFDEDAEQGYLTSRLLECYGLITSLPEFPFFSTDLDLVFDLEALQEILDSEF
jgi:hypothetical protein